jgi:hypothetical protein
MDNSSSPIASPPVLEMVVFIVEWSKIKFLSSVFEQANVRFHFVTKAQGTASSETLDLLGLGSTAKAVVLCLEQEAIAPGLLRTVSKKMRFGVPGTGIGFSVPLAAVNAPITRVFYKAARKTIAAQDPNSTNKENIMAKQVPCDLIVAILNQGYSDEFMTTARSAGAGGGTVINARGLMHKGPIKFFGISVQDEKEIIIILSTRAKMPRIMQAVSTTFGLTSKAEGIIFSLPAENITGVDLSGWN